MIRDLLLHGWKAQVRSPYWQRSLAVNILLGLLVAYMILNLLVLGFFLDVILKEAMPDTDPYLFVSGALLYVFLADLIFRFFLQSFPMMDVHAYLLLPVRKGHLFHYLLLKSVFNVFNLLPLLFFIPFAGKVVFPELGATAGWAWLMAVIGFTLFNNYAAFYLKRQFNVRPLAVFFSLGLIFLLGAADWQGFLNASEAFQAAMGAVDHSPYLAAIPFLLAAGVYLMLYRAMHYYTYLDAFSTPGEEAGATHDFAFLKRLGGVGSYMQLELRQIWRNKRPRIQLLMSVILLFYPFLGMDYVEDGRYGYMLFFWVLSIGFPMVNYGQYLFSWESPYFDFLMARNVSLREFIEAKYYLLAGFNGIVAAPCLLYGLIDPLFLFVVPAVALFNAGVNVYFVLYIATYNSRRIDPTKGDYLNWEGVGASQFLMIIPFFLLPIFFYHLFSFFGGMYAGLGSLAAAGLLGIVSRRFVLALIFRQFATRKHVLASNFKKK